MTWTGTGFFHIFLVSFLIETQFLHPVDISQYNLSSDQQQALLAFQSFMDSDIPVFILKGYAGTGKTFLTRIITRYLTEGKWQSQLLAPTGRAARILQERTGVAATTIHKGIYNMQHLDERMIRKNEKPVYKYVYGLLQTEPEINTVIIVDEASMVSDKYSESDFFIFGSGQLLKDLMQRAAPVNSTRRIKLLFIGDPAQLPPVGDPQSGALMPGHLQSLYGAESREIILRQVMRQEGESGILRIASYIRTQLEKKPRRDFRLDITGEDVMEIPNEDVFDRFTKHYQEDGPESIIMIHYRNKDAHESNLRIRALLFPDQPYIQPGDRLMIAQNNYNYSVDMLNGTFVRVISVHGERILKHRLQSYRADGTDVHVDLAYRKVTLEVPDADGCLHPQECLILESFLNADRAVPLYEENVAAYLDFKKRHPHLKPRTQEFKDTLRSDPFFNALKVKYGYAITCHKAQGGEWDTVIVNMQVGRSRLSDDFLRWTYTAVTRARSRLFIFNVPSQSPYVKLEFRPLRLSQGKVTPDMDEHAMDLVITQEQTEFRNTSGLDKAAPFLLDKYHSLLAQLHETGIRIIGREPADFQEKYGFQLGDRVTWLSFWYNGKQKFGKVSATGGKPQDKSLSDQIISLIDRTVHFKILAKGDDTIPPLPPSGSVTRETVSAPTIEYGEDEEHLAEFLADIKDRLSATGIQVVDIKREQWRERYMMVRGGERATVVFHYDGTKRMTSGWPLETECNSQPLLDDVAEAVEDIIKT